MATTNSLNKYDCPACPEGCTEPTVPIIQSEDCVQALQTNASEICTIYFADLGGYTFVDVTDPAEWALVIDNTATTGTPIRCLNVIADKPLPSFTTKTFSKNRQKTTKITEIINVTIDDTNDVNYEAIRAFQCGGSYCWWFGTLGCKLYGGNTGLKGSVINAGAVNARGVDSDEVFEFQITWDATCSAPRIDNPIA